MRIVCLLLLIVSLIGVLPVAASERHDDLFAAEVGRWLVLLALCVLAAVIVLRRVITSRTAALLDEVRLRAQREQELELEKGFVVNIMESLPSLFYLHDGHSFLRWNKAFEAFTGLSADKLSELHPLSLVCEEDRELTARKRSEIFSLGEAQWEARLLTGNGPCWHLITGSRMELDGVVYAVGTARDISAKKLAEQKLHESDLRFKEMVANLTKSEERYRLLFDRMLNGYAVCEVIVDGEGRAVDYRFLEVNASFEALTGVPREELIGARALAVMPQTEAVWVERFGKVALTEQPDQFEAFAGALGKWLKVAVYAPQPGQFAAVFSDISKRKLAEQALSESEEHVREIFAQSDDGLLLFEMDSFRIVEANPAALKLFGASRDELRALPPSALISPAAFRKLLRVLARDERGSGFQLERVTGCRLDGSTLLLSVRGKVLTLRNEYVVLCSVRDITVKAHLEDEMKATQAKLIQANKMTSLGMLVSGVAHEINNPNNFISVNSLMLADIWRDIEPILQAHREREGEFTLGGLPFGEMQSVVPRLLSGITEGSSRITRIVENMRDFVRKEEGVGERPIDVNRTIDSASSLLWHHIHRHTDSFTVSVAHGLPPASGSSQQLEQVIINLVMNALQALPGKECGVRVESGFDDEAGMITVSVIDEGHGMNKTVRKRLTEPFFSTKIDKGGTGLGLYISSSIIKDHHGTLTFHSAPGKGTTATIRLPRYRPELPLAPPPSPSAPTP